MLRAVAISILLAASGCAGRGSSVTRMVDGHREVGRFVGPDEWEHAIRAELDRAERPGEARALAEALDRDDLVAARQLALPLVASPDARVREFVGAAFLLAPDPAALERFVALHAPEPAFAIAWDERATALPDELASAVARGLAGLPRHAARGALALARANRRDEARAAIAIATATSFDDRLALAEAELRIGEATAARDRAHAAYLDGASTRALAIEARALDALGMQREADELRARVAATAEASLL